MKEKRKPKTDKTRAQLEAENDRLRHKLETLQHPDSLRYEGEHWYELVEYFDASNIERIAGPGGGSAYLMGILDHAIIIEVPKDTPDDEIRGFTRMLKENGISSPVLVVTAGVRFLKLGSVDEDTERKLDAAEVKSHEQAAAEREQLVREKERRDAQEAAIGAGHCPECGAEGFKREHGCVICGAGRNRPLVATEAPGDRPELSGNGLGGDQPGDGQDS